MIEESRRLKAVCRSLPPEEYLFSVEPILRAGRIKPRL
jgi:hypothetical protein